jgi:hypothetical protein
LCSYKKNQRVASSDDPPSFWVLGLGYRISQLCGSRPADSNPAAPPAEEVALDAIHVFLVFIALLGAIGA